MGAIARFCALIVAPLSACVAVTPADGGVHEVTNEHDTLINGTPITSDAEIGRFWGPMGPCTATLIRPRAILTAAHCFDYQSDLSDGASGGFFMYKNFDRQIEMGRYISLGTSDDTLNDIAVAELAWEASPQDDEVVFHDVASNFPDDDYAVIRIIGYGCGDYEVRPDGIPLCTGQSDFSVKREWDVYNWALKNGLELTDEETGQLTLTVSGDSGGPLIDPSGTIIAVISGESWGFDAPPPNGHAVSSRTKFANVPYNRSRILQALNSLGVE